MDVSYLSNIIAAVVGQSKTLQGRFILAAGYGNDLNAGTLNDVFTQVVGGISTVQKYPLCAMMPPSIIERDYSKGWDAYRFVLFFINQSFNTGNGISNIDPNTNTSQHTIPQDWAEMDKCARDFRVVINNVIFAKGLLGQVRENQQHKEYGDFVSLQGNDGTSGVALTCYFDIWNGANCEISDYPVDYLQSIQLP